MSKPKEYVCRAETMAEAMAAIGRMPKIVTDAIALWGRVEIVVRKRQTKRSTDQNRLQRKWLAEAGAQGDMTPEEYRGYCKLHFAVPMLRWELPEFRERYDRIIRPLPYEQKLELMQEPLDFPCTRLMNKDQKTRYLDAMYQHFTGLGFRLTDPGLQGMDTRQYKEAA